MTNIKDREHEVQLERLLNAKSLGFYRGIAVGASLGFLLGIIITVAFAEVVVIPYRIEKAMSVNE